MEIPKPKKVTMPAAKFLCMALLLICLQKGTYAQNQKKIDVKHFVSKTGRASISGFISEFDSQTTKIPGFIRLNGVVNLTNGDFTFLVMPGKYSIECGFVGKKPQKISRIKLAPGDSVFVKFYLTDDDTPLYEKPVKN